MRRRVMQFAAVAVVCAVAGGVAFAEHSDRIYDDDDQGYALVSGSKEFESAQTGHKWTAHIDYAVYAQGQYPDPGSHIDKGTHYIYAYQIFNDSTSTSTLSSFTVGLADNSGAANANIDTSYGVLEGTSPPTWGVLESVQWAFAQWTPGTHSTVLLFSSPNNYTFDSATLVNGGEGDTQSLPSPLPEPAVLILLCGGVVPILLKHRRKARAKV